MVGNESLHGRRKWWKEAKQRRGKQAREMLVVGNLKWSRTDKVLKSIMTIENLTQPNQGPEIEGVA